MATFDEALDKFVTKCQEISDVYMETNFTRLPKPEIKQTAGGRSFIRIIRRDPNHEFGSVHCFVAKVDGSNKKMGAFKQGDVFKADGWKSPARGVRGNIFDEHHGISRMGPYGPAYNR